MAQTTFYINPANIGSEPTNVIDGETLGFFPDDELTLGEIENRTPYRQLVNMNLVLHTEEDDKYSFGCVHT